MAVRKSVDLREVTYRLGRSALFKKVNRNAVFQALVSIGTAQPDKIVPSAAQPLKRFQPYLFHVRLKIIGFQLRFQPVVNMIH
jgi:hypothetical protein